MLSRWLLFLQMRNTTLCPEQLYTFISIKVINKPEKNKRCVNKRAKSPFKIASLLKGGLFHKVRERDSNPFLLISTAGNNRRI